MHRAVATMKLPGDHRYNYEERENHRGPKMRVQVDEPRMISDLARWLSGRGWCVADVDRDGADVLLNWQEDEFMSALLLRADIEVWHDRHLTTSVLVDPERWARPAA